MFQHLLVPIDGSDLTDRAMTASLELARQLGAAVTGFVAEPVAAPPTPGRPPSLIRQETLEHDAMTAAHANSLLQLLPTRPVRPACPSPATMRRCRGSTVPSSPPPSRRAAT